MANDHSVDGALRVTDERTGREYELVVHDGTIRATDLREIKVSEDDFGLLSFDPALKNTANVRSEITFVDGEGGILQHRGYSIERLASGSDFLEVAYLLVHGELPTVAEYESWVDDIAEQSRVTDSLRRIVVSFARDAHPMAMLVSTVGALSATYPEGKDIKDADVRHRQITRLIGQLPMLVALGHRHASHQPPVSPRPGRSFAGAFLDSMWGSADGAHDPVLERALDTLFLLHADHEQNCSTTVMRAIGSSGADPYSATAGAIAALSGPLHGGANEAVLSMLDVIETVDRVPDYVAAVKRGEFRLMGFGHRVYRSYDPRATAIQGLAREVFDVTGRNPLLDVALELERVALEDDYFVSRQLYPNVDFYSGLIYQAMGFPPRLFPALFAVGRVPGWLAQWQENVLDPDQAIARPRQVYAGPKLRDFVPRSGRRAGS